MPRWTEVLIAVAFVAMQIIGAIAAKKSKDAKAAELARQTGGTAGAPLAGGGRVQSPAVAQPPWKSARTMA
ncbi:MAG: hypothetical protein EXS00_07955, partial [Phycisphaerales bacterium]|nr:hypothetical protein [Phycisphaerales bacterium]